MDHVTVVEVIASIMGFSSLFVKSGVGMGNNPVPVLNNQVQILIRISFIISILWVYVYFHRHGLISFKCIFSLLNLIVAIYILHHLHIKEKRVIKNLSEDEIDNI